MPNAQGIPRGMLKWTSGEAIIIKELFGSGSGKFVLWVAQGVENI